MSKDAKLNNNTQSLAQGNEDNQRGNRGQDGVSNQNHQNQGPNQIQNQGNKDQEQSYIQEPTQSPNSQNDRHKKINLKEFWDVSKWTFVYLLRVSKVLTISYLVTSLASSAWSIGNTYIVSTILGEIIDLVQKKGASLESLYPYFLILLFFNIFFSFVNYIKIYCSRALVFLCRTEIMRDYAQKLKTLGIQTLESPEMSNKLTLARDSLYDVPDYFSSLVDLTRVAFSLLLSLILVARILPEVVILMLIIAVPRFLVDKRFRAAVWSWGYINTEERRKADGNFYRLFSAKDLLEISVIKAHKFLDQKFKVFSDYFNRKALSIRKRWFASSFFFDLISELILYTSYIYLFTKLIKGALGFSQVFFYLRILDMMQRSLYDFSDWLSNAFEYSIRFRELYLVFSAQPKFKDGAIDFPKLSVGPEVVIKNISFKYPNSDKLIFQDLSLTVKSGDKLAIVGHNGAGKTTLVKLLCRIYEPLSGQILVNGYNLQDLKLESWYENLGVLFQDFNVYPYLTVKENIIIGKPYEPVDEGMVFLAAEKSDALSFINEYPNKFDQFLSEDIKGGTRPSFGQWQKIALARFFYRNAPFIIFDEPTASIDAVSEFKIFNSIYEFFKNKTVIMISHRFSTVRNADRIIVLDHGKIIEEGSHEYLMSINGYYAKAFNLQARGYEG